MTTSVNGAAARAIRERSGLSVRDVVAQLKEIGVPCHEDHLRNVETGAKGASPRLVAGLAEVLKVPQVALLGSPATARETAAS